MTVTELLADRVARPVDAAARERAALHVLDWIGCAVIGAAAPAGRTLAGWAADAASGPCHVLGAGRRDAWTAALVNGAVGNVLEMDDIHRAAILHPGPVVVPAALALAEREGASAHGFLDAVVRGYEAMIRVGMAVGPDHYRFWHNTATCGPFGAAAAGGSLLGLDRAALVHAFGNAGTQAAGLWQVRHEPVMSKQLHNGRAAHAGLLAADLARTGFTGPATILEGPQGFFAAMCGGADARGVLADIDAPWRIFETGFKPWPACRHAHSTIDAVLDLRRDLALDDVRAIEVHTYRDAVAFCDRAHPESTIQAKFSLQHAVAVTLVEGEPRLEHFDPPWLREPRVAALRERVTVVADDALTAAYPAHFGARVAIHLANGVVLRRDMPDALGDSENPLPPEAIRAKAERLMVAGGLAPARAAAIADATLALPVAPVRDDASLPALCALLP
jgi:2-methylcitrate dehydratase PrpD